MRTEKGEERRGALGKVKKEDELYFWAVLSSLSDL